ncbi:transmembrane protein 272-like [Salmo trutta]|uniref:transmembrane protein 272-like n=1 Tax=Salmo trutta TaxID=8032 RepID=UPI001131E038|nr:transmembrane protein 272-like [Salmo trutta]
MTGVAKACHHCLSKMASNAYFVVGLLFFLAIPLTMAFVGVKSIDDCPVQPMIPLYLLVGGVIGSVKVTLLLYDTTHMRSLISKSVVIGDDDADECPWRQNANKYYVHIVLSLFLFVWFLLGNYWVFSVFQPNIYITFYIYIATFHQPQDYCRKSLYLFAVFVLTLSHTVLLLLL